MDEDELKLREILEEREALEEIHAWWISYLKEKCKKRECEDCPYRDYCPRTQNA